MTSRWWYAVAAAVAAGALFVATMIGFGIAENLEGAGIERVGEDGTVSVAAGKQLAVYADESADIDVACAAVPDNGGAPVRFYRPAATLVINGWERIALSPKGTAAGRYTLRCTPGTDLGPDESSLGVGNNPEIGGTIGRIFATLAVGGLGTIIALVIAIVTAVRRHHQQRPATRGQ